MTLIIYTIIKCSHRTSVQRLIRKNKNYWKIIIMSSLFQGVQGRKNKDLKTQVEEVSPIQKNYSSTHQLKRNPLLQRRLNISFSLPTSLPTLEEKWRNHFDDSSILQLLEIPGRILVPKVTQIFRSKWLHFFFQWHGE